VVQRDLDLMSAAEVYRPALVAELQARPYEFDVQVQLCADLAQMPVEDVTVEWARAAVAVCHCGQTAVPAARHFG
jgi:hypothetical protein